MANTAAAHSTHVDGAETRRDFLMHMTIATGAVGGAMMVWPLIHSMNPAADTLSMSTTELNVAGIQPGMGIVFSWRGRPVFARHRTAAEIDAARKVPLTELKDPEKDEDRVKKGHENMLILDASCTHLGCIPVGSKPTEPRGEFGGWFCPCHGSEYDTSGRIRRGPAPLNLPVVPYTFLNDTTVRVG